MFGDTEGKKMQNFGMLNEAGDMDNNFFEAKHNNIENRGKVLSFVETKNEAKKKNVQQQDLDRLDHNAKAEIGIGNNDTEKLAQNDRKQTMLHMF